MNAEHKGNEIKYDEEENLWRCDKLALSAPSLKQLRGMIDRHSSNERRVNVPALFFTRTWRDTGEMKEVTITILCEPVKNRYRDDPSITECWIVDSRRERSKVSFHNLAPLEARADVERWIKAAAAEVAAQKESHRLLEAIPRLDADAVALAHKELTAKKAS